MHTGMHFVASTSVATAIEWRCAADGRRSGGGREAVGSYRV